MKKNIWIAFLATLVLFYTKPAYAQELTAMPSATTNIISITQSYDDKRVKILKNFLTTFDSPLKDNAADFINAADRYNLDWKLVAAISGVESTFGHAIPTNSYNAWGWGVYGDNVIRFASWKEGINTVSQGIRQRYMDSWGSQDIYQIGRIYASSPAWAGHVKLYLDKIQEFALNDTKNMLSLSL